MFSLPLLGATGVNTQRSVRASATAHHWLRSDDDAHYLQAAAPSVTKTEIECDVLPADFVCITL